jgi:hypothetical protein
VRIGAYLSYTANELQDHNDLVQGDRPPKSDQR